MIEEFAVENFLSIKSRQVISFIPTSDSFMSDIYTHKVKDGVRLLKVGFIYGANASGKSNLLVALKSFKKLVTNQPKDRTVKIDVTPFLLDDVSRSENTKMSMTFYVGKTKYILSYEFNNTHIYSETLIAYDTVQPSKLYSRQYDKDTDSSKVEFGVNLKLSKKSQDIICGNTINNCSVLSAFAKSNVEKTRLNDIYDFFKRQVLNYIGPRMSLSEFVKKNLDKDEHGYLKAFVLRFLEASDFNIDDIELHNEKEDITPQLERYILNAPIEEKEKEKILQQGTIDNVELVFSHHAGTKSYVLPEKLESIGTLRYLGFAVILNVLLKGDTFLPIDEIENSIHYELLSYLIKTFLLSSCKASQLLLTTHDINLLSEDFIRRDAVWFTDKDEYGETQIVRLSSLGLHKNLSPYNAYKQNKLVKLPFLGTPYINVDE